MRLTVVRAFATYGRGRKATGAGSHSQPSGKGRELAVANRAAVPSADGHSAGGGVLGTASEPTLPSRTALHRGIVHRNRVRGVCLWPAQTRYRTQGTGAGLAGARQHS